MGRLPPPACDLPHMPGFLLEQASLPSLWKEKGLEKEEGAGRRDISPSLILHDLRAGLGQAFLLGWADSPLLSRRLQTFLLKFWQSLHI